MWFGKRIDPRSESQRNRDAVKSNDTEHVAPFKIPPARHGLGCVADNQAPSLSLYHFQSRPSEEAVASRLNSVESFAAYGKKQMENARNCN
jgi:hypothetical protein